MPRSAAAGEVATPPSPGGCLGQRGSAEPEFVAVGVTEGDLANAVRERFPIGRGEPPLGSLRDARVEVIDERQVPGVPGVLGPLLDKDESVLRELPHGLDLVRQERWGRAEESFVPRHGRRIVGDSDAREQISAHARQS
jgi:hypothetical protein